MQNNSRYRKASLLIHDKPDSFQETFILKAKHLVRTFYKNAFMKQNI